MSISASGRASRSFIIGIRLCPPATTRASGPTCGKQWRARARRWSPARTRSAPEPACAPPSGGRTDQPATGSSEKDLANNYSILVLHTWRGQRLTFCSVGGVSETSPAQTRRAWHGVAELVMAGPQYRRSGTIRLRRTSGGFGTTTAPDLRVDNDRLIVGDASYPLERRDLRRAGRRGRRRRRRAGWPLQGRLGCARRTSRWWSTRPPPPCSRPVSPSARRRCATCFPTSRRCSGPSTSISRSPPKRPTTACHPATRYLDEPYAYVGPFRVPTGPFWNAPFGAAHPLRELPTAAAVAAFFGEGRGLLA